MEFKGVQFEKKTLKIRQEAQLANLAAQLKNEDMEIKADAMISMTMIETTLTLEFLESLTMAEFTDLLGVIRPPKAQPAQVPASPEAFEAVTPSTSETPGN